MRTSRGSASLRREPPARPGREPALRSGRLLEWYRQKRRELPWRRTRDPYRIWISEVMLQQTTVKSVLPYYEAFLARFEGVDALARAREEDVLAAWSGLGYYHRARNLHRGAKHIVERHGGAFPRTLESACDVPGVGRYTASAVLSIAFDVPLPVVDGNVRRVLARLRGLRGPKWRSDAGYYRLAEELLDRESPGDWNQAVMELGATVCTPRDPSCATCPLSRACRARELGIQDRLPEARARRQPVEVTVAAAIVESDGRVLLVRRPAGRLMGGMWEVPQTSLESRGLPDLIREVEERHGLRVVPDELKVKARHAITFRRIRVEAYGARLVGALPGDPGRYRWAAPDELASLPMSSMTRKILRGVDSRQLSFDRP